MAIGFRTPTFGDFEAATASPTVSKPTGTVDGDFLIFGAATDTVHTVSTVPTGFTQPTAALDQAADTTFSCLTRVASGEPASYTFTNYFGTTEVGTVFMLAITGVDQTTPLDGVTATTLASAAANGQSWAAITPASNDAVVLGIGGSDPSSSARAATPNAGFTELLDHTETPNSINGWVYALYKQLVGAPTATTLAITIDGGGSNTMAKVSLVLRPAAAGSTTMPSHPTIVDFAVQRASSW